MVRTVSTGSKSVGSLKPDASPASPTPASTLVDPGALSINPVPFMRVWRMQRKEYPLLLLGALSSTGTGIMMPVRAQCGPKTVCVPPIPTSTLT